MIKQAFYMMFLCALSQPALGNNLQAIPELRHQQLATFEIGGNGNKCSATAVGLSVMLTATHCLADDQTVVTIDGTPWNILERVDDGQDHTLLVVNRSFERFHRVQLRPLRMGETIHIFGSGHTLNQAYRRGYVMGWNDTFSIYAIDMMTFGGDSGAGYISDDGLLVGVHSYLATHQDHRGIFTYGGAKPLNFNSEDMIRLGVVLAR